MVARTHPDGYVGCCAALRDADLRAARGGSHRAHARHRRRRTTSRRRPPTATGSPTRFRARGWSSSMPAHLSNVERAEAFNDAVMDVPAALRVSWRTRTGTNRVWPCAARVLGDAHVDRALENDADDRRVPGPAHALRVGRDLDAAGLRRPHATTAGARDARRAGTLGGAADARRARRSTSGGICGRRRQGECCCSRPSTAACPPRIMPFSCCGRSWTDRSPRIRPPPHPDRQKQDTA